MVFCTQKGENVNFYHFELGIEWVENLVVRIVHDGKLLMKSWDIEVKPATDTVGDIKEKLAEELKRDDAGALRLALQNERKPNEASQAMPLQRVHAFARLQVPHFHGTAGRPRDDRGVLQSHRFHPVPVPLQRLHALTRLQVWLLQAAVQAHGDHPAVFVAHHWKRGGGVQVTIAEPGQGLRHQIWVGAIEAVRRV